jgi:hypothetical protein
MEAIRHSPRGTEGSHEITPFRIASVSPESPTDFFPNTNLEIYRYVSPFGVGYHTVWSGEWSPTSGGRNWLHFQSYYPAKFGKYVTDYSPSQFRGAQEDDDSYKVVFYEVSKCTEFSGHSTCLRP